MNLKLAQNEEKRIVPIKIDAMKCGTGRELALGARHYLVKKSIKKPHKIVGFR